LQGVAGRCPRVADRLGTRVQVYFGRDGNLLVILLIGGDKRTQATDIRRALEYWQDYKRRSGFDESA
jgi:putative addiction module killer protein